MAEENDTQKPDSQAVDPASDCYALGDRRYFHAELVTFRKYMGLRTFWQDVDRARRALGGLFYVWMRTNDPTPSDGELIRSAADEFERRAMLMALARQRGRTPTKTKSHEVT